MTAPSLFDAGNSGEQGPTAGGDQATASQAAGYRRAATASLYRNYRPQSFDADELVGQEHVVRTLRNAIALDRVAHAYLFSGPRGTGKTTTARLLAKGINCLDPDPARRPCNACANCEAINAGASPDVIEIDAASNRGIDDIRDLRERVRYAPAQLESKVYIIDEAHQITGAAANAFLKTLEEPPPHAVFILATTDPEELLPTIVSRCQRFDFRRVGVDDVVRRLRLVAGRESVAIGDDALREIARHATGSVRDALGLLEQLSLRAADEDAAQAAIEITAADVQAALGLSGNDRVEGILQAVARQDAGQALRIVQDAVDAGEDPRQLNRQILVLLRILLHERSGGASAADESVRQLASQFTLNALAGLARRFGEIDFSIKHSPLPQLPLEIAIVESAAPAEQAERPRPRQVEPVAGEPEHRSQAAPTSLRDRLRNPSAIREAQPGATLEALRTPPTPITPLRPTTEPAGGNEAPPALPDVERLADLWPQVRADVKALNRRIEALLSEVDPVAVSGNQVTLAVPYPFHRDKLNTDEVRETVAGVLSRLLGREVSLVCILRGEVPALVGSSSSGPVAVADASAAGTVFRRASRRGPDRGAHSRRDQYLRC